MNDELTQLRNTLDAAMALLKSVDGGDWDNIWGSQEDWWVRDAKQLVKEYKDMMGRKERGK